MPAHTADAVPLLAAIFPMLAVGAGGIETNPIAAGISGAALASMVKIGPVNFSLVTFSMALALFAKFITTFLMGAAASIYGSPWLCAKIDATPETRVIVYLGAGLVGSALVRLVASYDKAIAERFWSFVSNGNTKPPLPPGVPPSDEGNR